jgi:hypothetical protein
MNHERGLLEKCLRYIWENPLGAHYYDRDFLIKEIREYLTSPAQSRDSGLTWSAPAAVSGPESMPIDTKPGSIVTLSWPQNGMHGDRKQIAELGLKEGDSFEVVEVEAHDWHTNVWLKGYPGRIFNSSNFSITRPAQPETVSDTPETDAGYNAHYAEHDNNKALCRKLERERNAALVEVARLTTLASSHLLGSAARGGECD